ncbi:MAG: nitrous oxide reductase accessory protein NosL [Candidatus Omnitrophica bacterium]|nr:nitrous oxide reductase accessory protein NosL [Candidatus Omnitrophota bacterium]
MSGAAARSIAAGLSVMVLGCGGPALDAPPRIRIGEDACATCHMIISEARFSASVTLADGTRAHFDDIGCLTRGLPQRQQIPMRIWVHAYQAQQWLPAHAAVFVESREMATPMGGGIVALSTLEEAQQLASATHGRVRTFQELLNAHKEEKR